MDPQVLTPHKVVVSLLLDLFVPPKSQWPQQLQLRPRVDSVLDRNTAGARSSASPLLSAPQRFELTQFVSRQLLSAQPLSLRELATAFKAECPGLASGAGGGGGDGRGRDGFSPAADADAFFETHVLRPLQSLQSLDDLENLFADFHGMVSLPPHTLFHRSGLFGLHLRWLHLAHQRLSFSALARFFDSLISYVRAYSSSGGGSSGRRHQNHRHHRNHHHHHRHRDAEEVVGDDENTSPPAAATWGGGVRETLGRDSSGSGEGAYGDSDGASTQLAASATEEEEEGEQENEEEGEEEEQEEQEQEEEEEEEEKEEAMTPPTATAMSSAAAQLAAWQDSRQVFAPDELRVQLQRRVGSLQRDITADPVEAAAFVQAAAEALPHLPETQLLRCVCACVRASSSSSPCPRVCPAVRSLR
jgi:hypothetical protein